MKKICDICKKEINKEINNIEGLKELKDNLIDFLLILLLVITAASIGFVLGKSLPSEEKYKVYSENRITYIERIQECN